tara:strand:+ start:262 stop:531 length:270 start_codon:yes stop_codon:yes gene_type:complete
MVIEIILGVSVLLNLVFLYGVRNLNKQNEQYQDYIQNELMSLDDVREKVTSAYDRMRDLDIRGSFESDDEVGASFKDILSVVEQLNQDI